MIRRKLKLESHPPAFRMSSENGKFKGFENKMGFLDQSIVKGIENL